MNRWRAIKLRSLIEKAVTSLDDEDALSGIELYPEWEVGVDYTEGVRIRRNNILYRVVQTHTSQADWLPESTPALYTVVSLDEWPEWVQPTGASDAYALGAKVSHNDKHWESDYDNNVWEPGVFGWHEVS